MLSSFRNLSKSKVGTVILGAFGVAILASFAVSDIGNFTSNGALSGGQLAKAGSEPVTDRDFTTAMDRLLTNARQQNPGATYAALAGDMPQVVEQLIDDAALKSFGIDHGMVVSPRLIGAEIAALPGTRGLDGKFSQDAYSRFLSQQRLSDQQVRQLLSADVIRRVLLGPIGANARVPVGVATPYASMLLEQRKGELVLVLNNEFAAGLTPTPADLKGYYQQNAQRYTVPEQRVLRMATITPDQIVIAPPSEADVAKAYAASSAQYAGKALRVISQAVVPTKQAADAIVARVRGGASFVAATAPAGFSAEDISVGPQTRQQLASLAGEKVASAAFAAARGGLVGPIQSDLGWHVVRIDDIRGDAGKSIDQVRPELVAQLTAERRKAALDDRVNTIEQAITDGSSLVEAAAAAKVPLVDTPLIVSNGTARGNPAFRLPPQLAPALKGGFDLTAEDDPVVETMPNDAGFILVGVGRIVGAAPAPLADIRAQVAADWVQKKSSDRARAVAAAIAAKTAAGMKLADAAKQVGKGVSPAQPFGARRIQLAQAPADIAAPLKILFSLATGKSRMIADPKGRGYFVVHALSITPGSAAAQPGLIGQVQTSFQQSIGQELAQQFILAVRKDVGIKRNETAIAAARAQLTSTGN